MNEEFVERLGRAFGGKSMAKVARSLKVPHATVRNYFLGRLPSPDVLIKIANETGVSLNWLLMGTGTMYAEKRAPVSLDEVLDERIAQIIDQRISEALAEREAGAAAPPAEFDVDAAVERFNDPERVMSEWLRFE